MDEDDDVFDIVDEEKYAAIVENRRSGTDFIVDDGKVFSHCYNARLFGMQ